MHRSGPRESGSINLLLGAHQRFTPLARERNVGIATMEALGKVAGYFVGGKAAALVVDCHRSTVEVYCNRKFEFLRQKALALSWLAGDSRADYWSPRPKA